MRDRQGESGGFDAKNKSPCSHIANAAGARETGVKSRASAFFILSISMASRRRWCRRCGSAWSRGRVPRGVPVANQSALPRLGLRSMVSLLPEQPAPHLITWCEEHGVRNHAERVASFREEVSLTQGRIAAPPAPCASRAAAVYVHCLDGVSVTAAHHVPRSSGGHDGLLRRVRSHCARRQRQPEPPRRVLRLSTPSSPSSSSRASFRRNCPLGWRPHWAAHRWRGRRRRRAAPAAAQGGRADSGWCARRRRVQATEATSAA